MDSYGSFYPEQIKALTKRYIRLAGNGRKVGIHAHNNQQLAFANTIEAMRCGAALLDVTVNGMGRGAGNWRFGTALGIYRLIGKNIMSCR